jgi:hypothetical protein
MTHLTNIKETLMIASLVLIVLSFATTLIANKLKTR